MCVQHKDNIQWKGCDGGLCFALATLWLPLDSLPKYSSWNLISMFIRWQTLLFCPKWHVTALLLKVQIQQKKRKNEAANFSLWSVCLSRALNIAEQQIAGHLRSLRKDDRNVAWNPKLHVSWQECIAHCIVGLCLGEGVQTPWLTGCCYVRDCRWRPLNFWESVGRIGKSVSHILSHSLKPYFNCCLVKTPFNLHYKHLLLYV